MNNRIETKVCGRCKYYKHDSQDFYCANEHSDNFTDYIRFGHFCGDWEGKHDDYQ